MLMASVRENGGSATDYADFSNNDIVGVAVDFDNGAFYVSKNGTYYNSGDPTSGSSITGALVTWTPRIKIMLLVYLLITIVLQRLILAIQHSQSHQEIVMLMAMETLNILYHQQIMHLTLKT